MARPADLPDFERPPVTEVILSLQFGALEKLKSYHIGLLWTLFRNEYPNISEQSTIEPVFETFGKVASDGLSVRLEQFLTPPLPRYWLEKNGEPDLLQVQQDRIIHNWRKRDGELIYPRYETLRDRFSKEVDRFSDFVKKEQIGEIRPNQCEVTYSNVILSVGGEHIHDRFEEISPLWRGELSEETDAEFEDARVQLRFKLVEASKHVGRVHVVFQPAVLRSDPSKQAIRLDITARGRPREETVASAFQFFDFGRRAVVKMFAAVTQPSMHLIWGRTNGRN
ncbi:MAG: TIGR04255 family protein [Xanthobacteraceae bacterium]